MLFYKYINSICGFIEIGRIMGLSGVIEVSRDQEKNTKG